MIARQKRRKRISRELCRNGDALVTGGGGEEDREDEAGVVRRKVKRLSRERRKKRRSVFVRVWREMRGRGLEEERERVL